MQIWTQIAFYPINQDWYSSTFKYIRLPGWALEVVVINSQFLVYVCLGAHLCFSLTNQSGQIASPSRTTLSRRLFKPIPPSDGRQSTILSTMPKEVKQKSGLAIGLNAGHVRYYPSLAFLTLVTAIRNCSRAAGGTSWDELQLIQLGYCRKSRLTNPRRRSRGERDTWAAAPRLWERSSVRFLGTSKIQSERYTSCGKVYHNHHDNYNRVRACHSWKLSRR